MATIASSCRALFVGFLLIAFASPLAIARISPSGNVTFGSPNSPNTTAVFDSTGTFVLQLSVTDGSKITNTTVTVTVNSAAIMPRICMGSGNVIAGNSVDVALAYSTGTTGVSSLQFDLALPAGVSSNTATAGPVITNAGKGIQTNVIGNLLRVLVTGLNQTPMSSGLFATLNLKTAPGLLSGPLPLTLSNVVGSDPAGINVPMTNCNGTLTVTANQSPAVTIGANQTITLPAPAALTANASDDGAPNPPGALTYSWSVL